MPPSGVNPGDAGRVRRVFPSYATALSRNIKKALKDHGDWWFGRMADRFRAPLPTFGQPNSNLTLHNRTGFLRNSLHKRVEGTKLKELGLKLWTDHPGAKIQEFGGVVRAKRAKFLAIPIEDNLTPAGVRRFPSPRSPEIADGYFFEAGGGLYYARRTSKVSKRKRDEGKVEQNTDILFTFKKSVEIPGPSAPTKRRPSRLGFINTAIGPTGRRELRRRLILANTRAVREAVGEVKGGS